MKSQDVIMPSESGGALPVVRRIDFEDLVTALASGCDDFRAMPTHVVFLSLIYPIIGLVLARAMLRLDLIPLLYPLATGFAIVGPFAAIGLYELSRRREQGLETTWGHALDITHSPSFGAVMMLGLLLVAILVAWVGIAHSIYLARFAAREPASLWEFVKTVVTTREGLELFIVGNAVGLLFAVLAFSLSVVSFPLLLDRHVSTSVAIATSVQVVLKNPITMAAWGLIVAGGLLLGSLPLFLGLPVVMPVLGHASWHLYRRAVVPDRAPRPEYQPEVKGPRYAADFPASLFTRSRRTDR